MTSYLTKLKKADLVELANSAGVKYVSRKTMSYIFDVLLSLTIIPEQKDLRMNW